MDRNGEHQRCPSSRKREDKEPERRKVIRNNRKEIFQFRAARKIRDPGTISRGFVLVFKAFPTMRAGAA